MTAVAAGGSAVKRAKSTSRTSGRSKAQSQARTRWVQEMTLPTVSHPGVTFSKAPRCADAGLFLAIFEYVERR